jgi:hypothetical protein
MDPSAQSAVRSVATVGDHRKLEQKSYHWRGGVTMSVLAIFEAGGTHAGITVVVDRKVRVLWRRERTGADQGEANRANWRDPLAEI